MRSPQEPWGASGVGQLPPERLEPLSAPVSGYRVRVRNSLPFIESTPAPKPVVAKPVRLPPGLIDQVIDRAGREGLTRAAMLAELVEYALSNRPPHWRHARRAG